MIWSSLQLLALLELPTTRQLVFFYFIYIFWTHRQALCPTVIDDVVSHPNSPSAPGLCVCERVSQLTSDRV